MHYLLFVESEHQYSFLKTSLVCLIIYCESSLRLLSAILSAEYFQTLFLVIMHQEKRIKSLKLGAFNNLIKTVSKVFNVIISWTYLRPHISPPPDCLVILIANLDLKVPGLHTRDGHDRSQLGSSRRNLLQTFISVSRNDKTKYFGKMI